MLPRIYADFNNLDSQNRLRLTCQGTLDDLKRNGIQLHEGLRLTFYMDDADDSGQPDELRIDGTIQHGENGGDWVAVVDWAEIRHASDEKFNGSVSAKDGRSGPVPSSTRTES
jgi:hypothetical protein